MQRKYKRLPRRKAGHTPWIDRTLPPIRHGEYECVVWFTSSAPSFIKKLYWDGRGFVVPFPMVVDYWRGLTKAAHRSAQRAQAAAKEGAT